MSIGTPLQSRGYDDLSVPLAVEVTAQRIFGPLHAVTIAGFDPTIDRDDTTTPRRGAVLGRRWVLGDRRAVARAYTLAKQHAALAGERPLALDFMDR